MIISGEAPASELNDAWMLILAEYYDLRSNEIDESGFWLLSRDILRLQDHLYILQNCIDFLSLQYSESIAASIRKMGYVFKPKSTNPDDYATDLDIVVSKSKTKYIKLKQLNTELTEKIKAQKSEKVAASYFEEAILAIEEMQHVSYSTDTLTVGKFVALEKKLMARIAANKNRKNIPQ